MQKYGDIYASFYLTATLIKSDEVASVCMHVQFNPTKRGRRPVYE